MFVVELFQKRTDLRSAKAKRKEKIPSTAHLLDRRRLQTGSFYQISYFARI